MLCRIISIKALLLCYSVPTARKAQQIDFWKKQKKYIFIQHTFSVAYTKQCVVFHISYKLNYTREQNNKTVLRHQVKLLI